MDLGDLGALSGTGTLDLGPGSICPHSEAVGPWPRFSTSPSLSFLFCKPGRVTVPTSWSHWREANTAWGYHDYPPQPTPTFLRHLGTTTWALEVGLEVKGGC